MSVIVIFLDAERFLEEAIQSVLAQTYPNWELLLVDDGSTDGSAAIARRLAKARPGWIRYLHHPGHANRGMSAARNLGLAHARGDHVAFLDADDVWLPHRLERHVAVLERDPELAAVYGPTRYWYGWTGRPEDAAAEFTADPLVGTDRRHEPPELLVRYLRTGGGATPCPTNLTVRRAIAFEVGGFEERFRTLGEDAAFLAKLWLARPVFVLGEWLARYRQHPDSGTQRALAAGAYHPKRPNPLRMAYLDWLESYLDAQGVSDRRLRRALRTLLIPYRHPRLYLIMNLPHRLRDGVIWCAGGCGGGSPARLASGPGAGPDPARRLSTLMHRQALEQHDAQRSAWEERQEAMSGWYQELVEEVDAASAQFHKDYAPFVNILRSFSGRILDIGGGCGFARRFLPAGVEYVSIDPSAAWLGPEWRSLAPGSVRAALVVGVGEGLPFRSGVFDGALAMWSLNHVLDPAAVVGEVGRVLRPRAQWLVVLEDMEPSWRDALTATAWETIGLQHPAAQLELPGRKVLKRKIVNRLHRCDWPIQADHLRIRERELARLMRGEMRPLRREWVGSFLTYTFERIVPEARADG